MTEENSIRVAELRFAGSMITEFNAFALAHGVIPSWSVEGKWSKALLVFQNAKSKRAFMSKWGSAQLVVDQRPMSLRFKR